MSSASVLRRASKGNLFGYASGSTEWFQTDNLDHRKIPAAVRRVAKAALASARSAGILLEAVTVAHARTGRAGQWAWVVSDSRFQKDTPTVVGRFDKTGKWFHYELERSAFMLGEDDNVGADWKGTNLTEAEALAVASRMFQRSASEGRSSGSSLDVYPFHSHDIRLLERVAAELRKRGHRAEVRIMANPAVDGPSFVMSDASKRDLTEVVRTARLGHASGSTAGRLFIGIFPAGIGYADRSRTKDGDYARVGFLPFQTLVFEPAKGADPKLVAEAQRHASTIAARRGEPFVVSASGQTVILGRSGGKSPRQEAEARVRFLVWVTTPAEGFGDNELVIGEEDTFAKAAKVASDYARRRQWALPTFRREESEKGVTSYYDDSGVFFVQKLYLSPEGYQSVYPPTTAGR